jgi:hypothetical protein
LTYRRGVVRPKFAFGFFDRNHGTHSMTVSHHPAPEPAVPEALSSDWEVLLDAVTTRLRLVAGEHQTVAPAGLAIATGSSLSSLRTDVLECALALDQIRVLIRDQLLRAVSHTPDGAP